MIVEERLASEPAVAQPAAVARPAEVAAPAPAESAGWTPLAAVLALLPVAALAELLLMRTFYRVGIYIPKEGPFRGVYHTLTAVGSFSFNLSTVLAAVALGLLAWTAAVRGRGTVAWSLGAFLVAGLLAAAGGGSSDLGPTSRLTFVLATAVVAWPYVRARGERTLWHRVAVAGIAVSAALSSYSGLVGDAGRLFPSGHGPGGATGAQLLGEAAVVLTAFALFASWLGEHGPRPRPVALALLPAIALIAAWKINGAITGILVLWTAGLRLFLPVWLYALALWVFGSAAIGWLREHPWRTAGLVLLLVGGFLMESSYQQSLTLIGLMLLTDGMAVGGLPDLPGRRRARRLTEEVVA
jgi:hypothetical protein